MTVVAVRDDGRVYATTATSFASISAEPARVLVSLGASAQVLPFLEEGRPFAVNVLAADQRRIASVYADTFPVGPSPFPTEGPPALPDAHLVLGCRVQRVIPLEGGVRLVVALVTDATMGPEGTTPLLYHERGYRSLGR